VRGELPADDENEWTRREQGAEECHPDRTGDQRVLHQQHAGIVGREPDDKPYDDRRQ
jgi:hypothetical protein